MKFSHVLCLFSISGVLAYPIAQSNTLATVGSGSTNATTDFSSAVDTSSEDGTNDPDTAVDDIKTDAAKASFGSKGSSAGGAKGSSSNTKVTSASVKSAVQNFANDANTVSSSLNQLGSTTDTATIKSLATTAFKAESDEDGQRSVLASAAGSAGSASNSKIVKNTPTVLNGLSAIMKKPTVATTKSNLATIQNARNPNILPSITQLSNAALDAMGLPQTAQKFPATTG
ncbi:uncharacterized protein LY89DRAFT_642756 [Mollisia scopiformis]|uniref:Ppe family protein n=1 Tax=Mollisia scopiformis TaxID=149040 RepID=A0A194XHK2_MOLSC|nr:uncharacterized protein LY89DRAFT_642756 [Mollisia scopiformis]KUJ19609.1 hypothetical protein LY89DRAFT_642756 [Mollisia scopiformis]